MLVNQAAALMGASAVGMGAFGAHALKESLNASGMTATYQTAVLYHLVHSCAVLSVRDDGWRLPAKAWVVGTILFSGSLYGLALGAPRWTGAITPVGGFCFILGWLANY
eukprot:m.257733 g.257733  ORF g.257733 m.257733 type:complete len:109 (+) comp19639_c0_seq4:104-430(+)